MAALGFASGLPYAIANETSTAMLAEMKIDRSTVGLLGAIGTLYAFKFLWSPIVDARAVPGLGHLGRRRSWLFLTQLLLVVLLVGLAFAAPSGKGSPLTMFAIVLVAVAFISATQDIVVNAWTVDTFARRELGIGSAMSVGGYRVALLVGAAVAMQLAALVGWRGAFVALAAMMGVGLCATLLAREPSESMAEPVGFLASLGAPINELVVRLGTGLLVVAGMVLLFRLPDQLGNAMQKLLLLETLEYEKTQYGYVRNGIGLAATILGSLIGGAVVARFGIVRALVAGALLQAASNLGFAWLATAVVPLGGTPQPWLSQSILQLLAVTSFENLCAGFVSTAFVAWLMSLCNRRFAATQYAILSGAMAFTGGIATGLSGFLAEATSWTTFFTWTAIAGIPSLALAMLAGRVTVRSET